MNKTETKELFKIAQQIRKKVIEMSYKAKSSHIASALSMIDILTVLYFRIMNIDPKNPRNKDRDIFILSKGHSCSGLYATLAYRGFFELDLLDSYYKDGSPLGGHPKRDCVPGIEASTGSLGHGLPVGCGIALNNKNTNNHGKVVVLMGDGECNEGSIYEAMMFATFHKLGNLIVIIDNNKWQGLGQVKEIVGVEPICDKWKAFGWNTLEIDGHNYQEIYNSLKSVYESTNNIPTAIIAHTLKGKGVSFMEDKLEWHYKSPNLDQLNIAIKELETNANSLY